MKFTLDSAEVRHREDPLTFWIPDLADRQSLRRGDCVKLIFRAKGKTPERMWVHVERVLPDGRYEGRLRNQPSFPDFPANFGDAVTFGPEHVIDKMPRWKLKRFCSLV